MRKILKIILPAVISALIMSGCGLKGEFDAEGYKILYFGDEVFMQRAIEQCDDNNDGKLSIKEASDIHYILYNNNSQAGLNFDNAAGEYGKIKNISEIHYFRYAQILLLGGNDLSGVLDLEKLTALRVLDLTGNTPGRLTKVIVNLATRGSLQVMADEDIEIEYYGYTGDDDDSGGDEEDKDNEDGDPDSGDDETPDDEG